MSYAELETPSLVIDVDRLERNIARMAAKAKDSGVALRPHVKTTKLLEVARMQLAAGAIGMTCATDRELRALQDGGVESVLWGHQAVGRHKVELAVEANRRGEAIVAVDSVPETVALGEHAASRGVVVPYVIEVDTGMERSGVQAREVVELARALRDAPGVRLRGVMTHEGHVLRYADVDDSTGLVAAAQRAAGALVDASRDCAAAGIDLEMVSVGSTPAASLAPFVSGITEVRPGTYAFYDANQVALGSATWDDCAVTVLSRVISRNRRGLPVIDAGLKELSGDRYVRGAGFGHAVEQGATLMHAYEEHGVLQGGTAAQLRRGDLVRIVPNHVCGTVNMWSRAIALRDGAVVGEWHTKGRR